MLTNIEKNAILIWLCEKHREKKSESGGTGRRARLRGVWFTPYGFKSRLSHQSIQTRTFYRLVKRSGLLFYKKILHKSLFVAIQGALLCAATSSFQWILLSVLPTLFFVIKIRSTPMRTIVYIVLLVVLGMSLVSFFYCRRFLPVLTFLVTAIEMMYLAIFDNNSGRDKLLTKIRALTISAFIVVTLLFSYNFVFKHMQKRSRQSTVGSFITSNMTNISSTANKNVFTASENWAVFLHRTRGLFHYENLLNISNDGDPNWSPSLI